MFPAIIIASNFIELGITSGNPVSPMKLQKLIYLANGIHLAKHDVPLIGEDIEAWSYGPVIPSIYNTFKSWGNQPITELPELEIRIGRTTFQPHIDLLTEEATDSVNLAWGIGSLLSGVQLSNWSHSVGSPWQQSYTPGGNKKIKRELIKKYFRDTFKIEA